MKKLLIVEDDWHKLRFLQELLNKKNVEIHLCTSITPAIKYAVKYSKDISGIILDLGLTSFDDSRDYEWDKGLILVKELTRKRINIPILINSTTIIDLNNIMINHPNVIGQMCDLRDGYSKLEEFITLLEEKKQ